MGLTHEKTFVTLKDLNIGININRPMAWCDETRWQMIYHYHRELEIIYVDKGSLICGINSDSFTVSEGDIVFFPSMTPHYTYTNESGSARSYIQFLESDFFKTGKTESSLDEFMRGWAKSYYVFKAGTEENKEFSDCLEGIFYEFAMKKPFYENFVLAGIYHLMAILYRRGCVVNPELEVDKTLIKKIMPAVEYVEKNYKDNLRLSEASGKAGLSEYYFCRLFKRVTGANFNDFINFVRVKKAEEGLSGTTDQIAEVAAAAGFTSNAYFNYVFKKIKGCTPSQYRKYKRQGC